MSKTTDKVGKKVVLIDFTTYQLVANESHRRKVEQPDDYSKKEKSITFIVSDAIKQVYSE